MMMMITRAGLKEGAPSKLYDESNPDWAPSLELGHTTSSRSSPRKSVARYQRTAKRRKRAADIDTAKILLELKSTTDNVPVEAGLEQVEALAEQVNDASSHESSVAADTECHSLPSTSQGTQTELTKGQINDLQEQYNLLVAEKVALEKKVHKINEDYFLGDDERVRFYTGDELRETMPMCFRAVYGKRVAVIIDCFEVFMDRPSNLLAQAQTWSSYKHHNTVKFLIGITPQGCVSFISQGWGGRTSDKYITEHCGFLSNIIPGDVILADRGFDIAESVALMQASVEVPTFMGGKKQLSGVDVIKTRNIANVRIHVERVIGMVRQKYKILGGPLPVDYAMRVDNNGMSTIDKIATVCCALMNLCPSVISVD
ncbi:hypothetical protein Pmani_011339 [Petrolisthes manimaculis]|uniref:DDE Tnp4 domain-containing protein n=1 Tax=Petrolisthes manimaculis TaxID=1843537 RepID=A0AAE1PZF1_9EUCA|nr:hypothetical protein Pmani_011339 [Petrolisthes manimaculis]